MHLQEIPFNDGQLLHVDPNMDGELVVLLRDYTEQEWRITFQYYAAEIRPLGNTDLGELLIYREHHWLDQIRTEEISEASEGELEGLTLYEITGTASAGCRIAATSYIIEKL